MEIILIDGFGFELTVKAMRMYLEGRGIDGYLYAWPEQAYGSENRMCIRIDDVNDFIDGHETSYDVVSKDLGKVVPFEVVRDNLIPDEYNLYSRTDKTLIGVLKELKEEASAHCQYSIATIPDDIKWHIDSDPEYGGEWVVEGTRPRIWYGEPL